MVAWLRGVPGPFFELVRARIKNPMVTTIDLAPSEALALSDEGVDYGDDSDDKREEEHSHGRRGGGGGGGGVKAVRNWHVDAVGEWKRKRALIRKRKEKEEGRKQTADVKAAAEAAKKKNK